MNPQKINIATPKRASQGKTTAWSLLNQNSE